MQGLGSVLLPLLPARNESQEGVRKGWLLDVALVSMKSAIRGLPGQGSMGAEEFEKLFRK